MVCQTRRHFLKTTALLGASASVGFSLTGCQENDDNESANLRFAVLSDLHVYDISLGEEGAAFESYVASDRKMLVQSTEILSAMVEKLLEVNGLQAVLIPGDLTKDGELVCHNKATSLLQPLRDAGIAVFVVPGNHDINNPDAVSFSGETTTPVESVTADKFANIYQDFGYDAAIARHDASLSYVAEPVEGVWLIGLDSCKYSEEDNAESPETSGQLTPDLLDWVSDQLSAAQAQNKTVFGMLHHGVVPHFGSQPDFFSEYLIDDYETVGKQLAAGGLNLVFTGHFHAQDIASADYNKDGSLVMYDVETGSVVTSPCPFRLIDLDTATGSMNIVSTDIDSIDSMDDFATYKETFIYTGMENLYKSMLPATLEQMGVTLSDDELETLEMLAAALHVAHYKGDESPEQTTLATLTQMINSGDTTTAYMGSKLYQLAVDDGLADNSVSLSPWSENTALIQRWLNHPRQTA
ncbi:Calcineurin-like phosphoesterase superfamily domain protein [Vibrio aerogenes CECT 7868]|uniref:Calcineurin-like phosphoesterase superfamily domain protein n=1 Tax=Vibrio aerogenes CECT 7868 TaxID=1216006 RepID=A0A1M5ZHG9_9VIBR|nr:metallophosphoesterase [Vibrio aerogenes]SHI23621.1 Calcineurin-like phosphoesterase superfamily domain protein [Vibrio aerogenes CECT 7868]